MVVYIEYAFIWNFLLDGVLLAASMRACKRKTRWIFLLLAAFLGGIFALVYPFMQLPIFCAYLLKFSVGCLLVLAAFGRIKNKKDFSKYVFCCATFFALTFAFGGGILAIAGEHVRKGIVLLLFALLSIFFVFLTRKFYQKRAIERGIYACKIGGNTKKITVSGFYDSGNLASHNGQLICFLSPEIFYDVFGLEMQNDTDGKIEECFVEIAFSTISGRVKTKARLGEIEVLKRQGERVSKLVYFAPSKHIITREYKLLLHADIFE